MQYYDQISGGMRRLGGAEHVAQTEERIMSARAYARVFVALLVGSIMLGVTVQAQTTWYVDDDAPNDPGPGDPLVSDPLEDGSAEHPFDAIQEGIDAVDNGDTVLVLDGTYTGDGNRDLDFGGKAITVRSENGPESCMIDCTGIGGGFSFHSEEAAASILDGFSVTGADRSGIFCSHSSPTIRHCTISGNVDSYGGGVYCGTYSFPTIERCTISGNDAAYGGGVFCDSFSWPTIQHCTIIGNSAPFGGGIFCESSPYSPTIRDCTIAGNWAEDYGGGVLVREVALTIDGCTIIGNTAGGSGGGIHDMSPPYRVTIDRCVITGNSALHGGGLTCSDESTICSSLIAGNSALALGGGVFGGGTIANCTICMNTAGAGSGGLDCWFDSYPAVSNCILWGDTPVEIPVPNPIVTYSDVQGGWPGEGNINADPLFVDPDGPDNDPNTWEDNDYHLINASPCIDAGDPNFIPDPSDRDIDGQWRVWDGNENGDWQIDMGADEFGSHCPGDLDGDNDIDLTDLGGLLANYGAGSGMTPADGDSDLDGDVDLSDLSALLAVYGTSCD